MARPLPACGEQPVDVAVVGAGELQQLLAAGRRAREAHGAHRRLGAREVMRSISMPGTRCATSSAIRPKRIAVERVIDGERQIPRQAEIDANRCPIAVEAVISAGQPHVAYGKGRLCMKLSTPVEQATHRQARRVREDRLRECFEKSDVPVVSECGVPGPPDLAVQTCIANHTIVVTVVLDDD